MNTAKHTPGPWNCVDPHVIRGPKNVVVAKTLDSKEGYEIKQANAHLIAAAPAMYEALKDAIDTIAHMRHYYAGRKLSEEDIQKIVDTSRTALAQAEGSAK